ncbi:MAG: hypothetical protein JEZ06_08940 [Anaerolineaceae bacterium]|nr:hypothetical protein [Anaerolineaceae bacterium]
MPNNLIRTQTVPQLCQSYAHYEVGIKQTSAAMAEVFKMAAANELIMCNNEENMREVKQWTI